MGLELALFGGLALASTVVDVVGGAAAADKSRQAFDKRKKATNQRRKARRVQTAQNKIQAQDSRRQAIREARLRRARLEAAAENTGTTASSGAIGAGGSFNSELSNLFGRSYGEGKGNKAISSYLQTSENFMTESDELEMDANEIGAWTGAISGGLNAFGSALSRGL